jgi:predicted dehydrogenase
MSNRYSVMVVGMGKRGMHHATHFHANPNFKIVGICDIKESLLTEPAKQLGNPAIGTDARAMAMELKPDLFCFCTLPNIRSEMIKIGLDCGAKMIAFEKPVALTSDEGLRVKQLIDGKKVKVVVSHQHRYGKHYQAVKEVIGAGKIGKVHTVYGYAHGWAAHMLSHIIDYSMWYNDYAKPVWVMAQAAGKNKFSDPKMHESPDYIGGFAQFANGVRGIYECGGGAPDIPEVQRWWGKNRIGAIGTEGYAEVYTGNGWKAVTKDGILKGEGSMDYALDMPGYIQDMAVWLNDDAKVHACCFANAYAGFEIMMGMFRSAAMGGQIALPLATGMNELAALKKTMPDSKLLVTLEESKKEYNC